MALIRLNNKYIKASSDFIRGIVGLPVSNFSFTPTSGDIDLTVNFTDTSTVNSSSIVAWNWDFGDGNGSNVQNPSHTYTTADTFTISLIVTSANGRKAQSTQDITVSASGSVGPTANFAFVNGTSNTGDVPHSVQIDSTSTTGDTPISLHFWDFGDGTTQSGGFSGVTKTYNTAGTYTITLTVTDQNGLQDTHTESVTVNAVSNPPPMASFTVSPSSGEIPFTISVDASSSTDNGSISSYAWDYGDGNTGTGITDSHTYTVAGTYTITLTVTDNEAATDTDTRTVTALAEGSGGSELITNVINRVYADDFASTGFVSKSYIENNQGPFDYATKGFGNGYQNRSLLEIVDNPTGVSAGRWMKTIRPGGLDAHTFTKALRVVGQTTGTYPDGYSEFWMKMEFAITTDWVTQNQGKPAYSWSNINGASPGSNPTNSTELLFHFFGPKSPKTSGLWPSTNPAEPSGGWSDQAMIMGVDVYANDTRMTNSYSEPIICRVDATGASTERAVFDVGDHCVFWVHYKHNTGSNSDGVLRCWYSKDGGASYNLGVNILDMRWSTNNTLLQYPGFVQFYGGSGTGFEPGGAPSQNNGNTHAVQDYWLYFKEIRTQLDNPLPSIFI